MKFKKVGVLSLSAALALGTFAPLAAAESSSKTITVTESEVMVEDVALKEKLLKRIHQLFPGKFDMVKEKDIYVHNRVYYGEYEDDGVERYHVSFNSRVENKHVHGSFEFVGKDLELHSFYYSPSNTEGAFYPPSVSEQEALKLAEQFLQGVSKGVTYQYNKLSQRYYHHSNSTLTEPVRYEFQFDRIHNAIPVRGNNASIAVLGNGEIVSYYGGGQSSTQLKFEEKKNVLDEQKVLTKIKENFDVSLYYLAEYDHVKNETSVYLAYLPTTGMNGVHAITGKWNVGAKFLDELPAKQEVKMLATQPAKTETKALTNREARDKAAAILKEVMQEGTVRIESVQERDYRKDQKVFSVQYTIEGSPHFFGSIELDAATGDIVNFYYDHHMMGPEKKKETVKVSYDEALKLAAEFVNKYYPSKAHQFAYPLEQINQEANYGRYHFSFPRVANGIPFMGDNIYVSISSETGKLLSLSSSPTQDVVLPALDQAVDLEKAKKDFLEQLQVKLYYANFYEAKDKDQYYLIYQVDYNKPFSFYDAVKGDWTQYSYAPKEPAEGEEKPRVTHRWAEKELNFMIDKGIIKVKNFDSFNPDLALSKGDALEVVMRSLTQFWEGYRYYGEEPVATFENIKPDHPLFEVVERAAQMGILDRNQKTFNLDEKLTRQELAVWYVRALRLQEAAKHSEIYQVNYQDTDQISAEYKGYIALASAFGILTGSEGKFSPKQEVTMAQLAIATFRLANTINTLNQENRHYFY